jgi:hypothetical protein
MTLLRRSCFALGWALLGIAVLQALTWLFACPHAHDFGVMAAEATYNTMLVLPPFLLASACFLYVARRVDGLWARRLYWMLFVLTLLIWSLTFKDFYVQPTRGWEIFLGRSR